MLTTIVSIAYLLINLGLAFVVLSRTGKSIIGKFYTFCVACVILFGVSAFGYNIVGDPFLRNVISILINFLFSMIPFFFLHFIVLFLRKYEVLKSKWVVLTIYFAGMFSYTTVTSGLLPEPIQLNKGESSIVHIYFVTWMSVFFSIGIAILYSQIRRQTERVGKSSLLFTAFTLLLLILPSPFTYSLSLTIFNNKAEWYGATSIIALIASVYFVFRHKILTTLYDSVKAALFVMDDVFIMTDKAFQIEVARGGLTPILGYAEQDMIGKNLNEFLEEKEYITSYLEYVSRGKMRECRFDTVMKSKEGSPVILNFSFSPIIENEQIDGFVGIGRNISEQKHHEKQIRLLAQALETTSEYIWITDAANRIVYINRSLERAFGYTHGELYLRHPIILFSSKQQDKVLLELVSRKSDRGWSGELTCCRKDGTEFTTLLSTSVIESEPGVVLGFVGVARDISEYKLIEEQLRQSQKLESVGTLAGGIAHDFNNILAIIMSYDSMLARGKLSQERADEAIKMIRGAVDRGAAIVKQLLTIARKNPVDYGPLSINKITLDMVSLLKETFPKIISFNVRIDTKIPEIIGDQSQFEQVLLNLCVNARDAMPKGGELTIITVLEPGDRLRKRFPDAQFDNYFHLSIKDTGTGIDETIRQKIFEPFFTTKEIGKGTGLGLAVVYSVVSTHHGFIDLESQIGKGTTFHLYIPIIENKEEQKAFAQETMGELLGNRETILLIEDEEALLKILQSDLEANGYRVITALDGVEGYTKFSTNQNDVDLVVSDLGLPKMGGWECYQKMKEIDPNVNVIMTSGYIDADLKEHMESSGVKGYLIKPYPIIDLLVKIRAILHESRGEISPP